MCEVVFMLYLHRSNIFEIIDIAFVALPSREGQGEVKKGNTDVGQ